MEANKYNELRKKQFSELTHKEKRSVKEAFHGIDITGISNILGIESRNLRGLAFNKSPVKVIRIPKKSGGERIIHAPDDRMKRLLRKLSFAFYCSTHAHPHAHGFSKGRSIVSNAKPHVRKNWVINIDLKDYFSSFHFGRLRGLFMSNLFDWDEETATTIAKLVTYNDVLVQGSPVSPVLTNILTNTLDRELTQLANRSGSDYTRYADDITFSTRRERPPASIALFNYDTSIWRVGDELASIIRGSRQTPVYEINEKKFRVSSRWARQEVTGIIVNTKVSLRRNYDAFIRSAVHKLAKDPIAAQKSWEAIREPTQGSNLIAVIKGKMLYLRQVMGASSTRYKKLLKVMLDVNFAEFTELAKDPELSKLAEQIETIKRIENSQQKGKSFEDFLKGLWDKYADYVVGGFSRNNGEEQIDGAFVFRNTHFLMEAKNWKNRTVGRNTMDAFVAKIWRSAPSVMGVMIAMDGISSKAENNLRLNPEKRTLVITGKDLVNCFDDSGDFREFFTAKVNALTRENIPNLSYESYKERC